MPEGNITRLRAIISLFPGESWDDQVCELAEFAEKSRPTVYRWLSIGAPSDKLDAIEFNLSRILDSE